MAADMKDKIELFEKMPIPQAVAKLSIPMIIGSLVSIIYNLADTYFVGMLNDPIQNAGVTLAAPVMLAFNAVNNLFGVGSSSMMSRLWDERIMKLFINVLLSPFGVRYSAEFYFHWHVRFLKLH